MSYSPLSLFTILHSFSFKVFIFTDFDSHIVEFKNNFTADLFVRFAFLVTFWPSVIIDDSVVLFPVRRVTTPEWIGIDGLVMWE